jgi:3alpha(or 20beta)-hydroxysteroid dehydrogenase
MAQLTGKVALISGSARGQGAREAQLFVAEGARVMVSDVLEDEGRAVAAALGEAGAFVRLDTTKEADWSVAVAATVERFGRLDILVNNAGIAPNGTIESTTLDAYLQVVMINQVGVFLGMKHAFPALKQQGGAIVNISSVAGLHGSPSAFGYGATKWAVRGMTKSAALDWAKFGIRVNSVHPSFVETQMIAEFLAGPQLQRLIDTTPLGRIAQVDDIAKVVLFLASDASGYCTGTEVVVDGGRMA